MILCLDPMRSVAPAIAFWNTARPTQWIPPWCQRRGGKLSELDTRVREPKFISRSELNQISFNHYILIYYFKLF